MTISATGSIQTSWPWATARSDALMGVVRHHHMLRYDQPGSGVAPARGSERGRPPGGGYR